LAALEQADTGGDASKVLDWYEAEQEPIFLDIEAEDEVEDDFSIGGISFGGSAVSSNLPVVYRNAQLLVAARFGTLHSKLAPHV
jgi:hypothetical protein